MLFWLNAVNNLSMHTQSLLENNFTLQITKSDSHTVHIYGRMAVSNVCTQACQSECASLGTGEITEVQRAVGCQGKDLYRAVAAAETDIGRHGMHDKSQWTGGATPENQQML